MKTLHLTDLEFVLTQRARGRSTLVLAAFLASCTGVVSSGSDGGGGNDANLIVVCTDNAQCPEGFVCSNGICTNDSEEDCRQGAACPANYYCDQKTGRCIEQSGATDADGDGYYSAESGGDDCDDTRATVHPGAEDVCGNGIDEDCSGSDAQCACSDSDGDGYPDFACGGTDCNDSNSSVSPGAAEACDGSDNDCDGQVDEDCPHDGNVTVCESIRALAGTQSDASIAIQQCIDATPPNGILELPAGIYRIDRQIAIQGKPTTVRSEGKNTAMPGCATNDPSCAELRASTMFQDPLGILLVEQPGSSVDHIVLDGNKAARWSTLSGQQCQQGHNGYGFNMRIMCDDCVLSNSVSKNSLCGTGCEVAGSHSRVSVTGNTFANNGIHDSWGLWSDGLTVHDYPDSVFTGNVFIDNTDIDLIFGGCPRCVIQNNTIQHSDAFAGSSFAALMLYTWPTTSGNFTGADVSSNLTDCGPQRRCGFGLYIGSDAWQIGEVFGGSVHDNTVLNAQQGVLIDDAHDVEVFDNPVANPASSTEASCGTKPTSSYSIGTRSYNIDRSRDTLGTVYVSANWDGCIPNWWNSNSALSCGAAGGNTCEETLNLCAGYPLLDSYDCAYCCSTSSCGALGGTVCENNGNGVCNGRGPRTYDCEHCCGGTALPSCGGAGGNTCEETLNLCAGYPLLDSYDCAYCCAR